MPMPHRLRTLAPAIYFGEGPRWRNGRLYFSDFYAHKVLSVIAQAPRERLGIALSRRHNFWLRRTRECESTYG